MKIRMLDVLTGFSALLTIYGFAHQEAILSLATSSNPLSFLNSSAVPAQIAMAPPITFPLFVIGIVLFGVFGYMKMTKK